MQIFCVASFRYNGMTLFRYYEGFEISLMGENGLFGQYGVDKLGDIKIYLRAKIN